MNQPIDPLLRETLWGPLWRHMHEAHGLILVDDECNQIAQACDKARMTAGSTVSMILINALTHLSQEEKILLGKSIAAKCDHTLVPMNGILEIIKN